MDNKDNICSEVRRAGKSTCETRKNKSFSIYSIGLEDCLNFVNISILLWNMKNTNLLPKRWIARDAVETTVDQCNVSEVSFWHVRENFKN